MIRNVGRWLRRCLGLLLCNIDVSTDIVKRIYHISTWGKAYLVADEYAYGLA
jgi:hypothetical protein